MRKGLELNTFYTRKLQMYIVWNQHGIKPDFICCPGSDVHPISFSDTFILKWNIDVFRLDTDQLHTFLITDMKTTLSARASAKEPITASIGGARLFLVTASAGVAGFEDMSCYYSHSLRTVPSCVPVIRKEHTRWSVRPVHPKRPHRKGIEGKQD